MVERLDEYRSEVDEYRELDDERVLALVRFGARGKTSGLGAGRIDTSAAAVYHVRGGKVTKLVVYFDREQAFADLGVSPEARSSIS